jgi:hypothetical protein
MQVVDAGKWAEIVELNSHDGYSRAVITYAERWADAMEAAIANGETLEQCAERTSREADKDGITYFMYGAAVGVLAESWQHGDELRRWHNLGTQLGNEGERANESGGVLNPAMIGFSE